MNHEYLQSLVQNVKYLREGHRFNIAQPIASVLAGDKEVNAAGLFFHLLVDPLLDQQYNTQTIMQLLETTANHITPQTEKLIPHITEIVDQNRHEFLRTAMEVLDTSPLERPNIHITMIGLAGYTLLELGYTRDETDIILSRGIEAIVPM